MGTLWIVGECERTFSERALFCRAKRRVAGGDEEIEALKGQEKGEEATEEFDQSGNHLINLIRKLWQLQEIDIWKWHN